MSRRTWRNSIKVEKDLALSLVQDGESGGGFVSVLFGMKYVDATIFQWPFEPLMELFLCHVLGDVPHENVHVGGMGARRRPCCRSEVK